MGRFTFDDDDDDYNGDEPTFSLGDFKKWLTQQRKEEKVEETIKSESVKDETEEKKKFKERLRKRKKKD